MLAARQAPQPSDAGLAKGSSGWVNRSRVVILAVGRLNFLSVASNARVTQTNQHQNVLLYTRASATSRAKFPFTVTAQRTTDGTQITVDPSVQDGPGA